MEKQRPVALNLFHIRFPITAIVSILHRVSGVLLLLFIPFLLWQVACSLRSQAEFTATVQWLTSPMVKTIVLLGGAALVYHLIAGVRHLLMDMHLGEGKQSGRCGAWAVLLFSGIAVVVLGGCLWSSM